MGHTDREDLENDSSKEDAHNPILPPTRSTKPVSITVDAHIKLPEEHFKNEQEEPLETVGNELEKENEQQEIDGLENENIEIITLLDKAYGVKSVGEQMEIINKSKVEIARREAELVQGQKELIKQNQVVEKDLAHILEEKVNIMNEKKEIELCKDKEHMQMILKLKKELQLERQLIIQERKEIEKAKLKIKQQEQALKEANEELSRLQELLQQGMLQAINKVSTYNTIDLDKLPQHKPNFSRRVIGGYGGGEEKLNLPHDIMLWNEHVYVADTNRRVTVFDLDGNYVRSINLKVTSFEAPRSMVMHTNGSFFVTCHNHSVKVIDSDGSIVSSFGSRGSGSAQFNQPRGIVFDKKGRVVICDQMNNRICFYRQCGTFVKTFKIGSQPFGLAINSKGNLIVSLSGEDKVVEVDTEGKVIRSLGNGKGSGIHQMKEPMGVCVDYKDNIFIADYRNDRVLMYGSDGLFLAVLGAPGDLRGPVAVAVHPCGTVYVADHYHNSIYLF